MMKLHIHACSHVHFEFKCYFIKSMMCRNLPIQRVNVSIFNLLLVNTIGTQVPMREEEVEKKRDPYLQSLNDVDDDDDALQHMKNVNIHSPQAVCPI